MYIPKAFAIDEATALDLIPRYPLATVIRTGPGEPVADQIPLILLHHQDAQSGSHRSVLQGHVARNNPLAQEAVAGGAVLVVFHGPAAYISPGWYTSKREDPRVVPTWNYAVVQIQGQLRAVDDHDWLTAHLTRLTQAQEAGHSTPWRITDAPADYISRLKEHILGIEIDVLTVTGKFKASQNQPRENRLSVIDGLRRCDPDHPMADLVASLLE